MNKIVMKNLHTVTLRDALAFNSYNKRNYPNRQFQETFMVFFMSNDNETTLHDLIDINIKILNADYSFKFH